MGMNQWMKEKKEKKKKIDARPTHLFVTKLMFEDFE